MNIADLRARVSFGRYVGGVNDYGDPVPPRWQEVATVWAAVEGLRGLQFFAAQQALEQSDHRIVIRWRRGIGVGMLARHDGREYTVQAVLDRTGRREWLDVICREAKPA